MWVNSRTDQKTYSVQSQGHFNVQVLKSTKRECAPIECLVKLFHKNCTLPFGEREKSLKCHLREGGKIKDIHREKARAKETHFLYAYPLLLMPLYSVIWALTQITIEIIMRLF